MKRAILLGFTLGAAFALPALANDSSAELAAGGLVLVKNPGVEMRSEDLYISETQVRVRYRFRNTRPRDVKVLVAFPMPDIAIEGVDNVLATPTEDPQNILAFHTTVDGRPVAARVEQKALSKGVDRTALLKSLGVPLAPHLAPASAALDRLPKAEQARLLKLGLAIPNDYDAGKGWEHHLQPVWTLKTTYYWDQTFPAGRDLAVEHVYKPSVGASAGTSLEADWFQASPDYRRMKAKYCIDDAFMAAVARRKAAVGPDRQAFFEKRIDYVLSSGGNWKSPIHDFRLVVDKGRADALVSFCAEGVKKIGPTQFEVRKTGYRPRQDLSILILEPAAAGF